jgi:ribosomal protein S18 acetylase RimI-like enzyme
VFQLKFVGWVEQSETQQIQYLIYMQKYLQSSEIIDWHHPEVLALAHQIASTNQTISDIAKACFEWVRDEIHHSRDYQMNPVTCRASDVLKYKTGYCFAKSHLLAALLRANNIPAGLCYQRLSMDAPPAQKLHHHNLSCTLHGLNAIFLSKIGWYRVDPRGNREGVNARFTPPQEQLAFRIRLPQEADFGNIFSEPLPIVIEVLQSLQASGYNIRALTNQDESILWTMLMYAAHESSVDIVRENPALDRYVKDWGRSGEFGLVAIDNTHSLGAAWLRLFSSDNRGFGYVDEGIPELAIAVSPEYRGKGIGTKLLMQTIELARSLYPAISLSVRANNPVINLYRRAGFVKVDGSEILNRTGISSFNMIYRFD